MLQNIYDSHEEHIDTAIKMIKTYVKDESVEPIIDSLKALRADARNETYLAQLSDGLDDIGIMKGAVLTYAPYINILLSEDLFVS